MLGRTSNYLREKYSEFFLHHQWNVGVIGESLRQVLDSGAKRIDFWFPSPPGETYYADPFVIEKEGSTYVFFEEYDYLVEKGRICYAELSEDSLPSEIGVALELPVHASYPYLLDYRGETYMVPETAEAREIQLFQAREFPHRWTKAAVLMDDIAAVDSTVFQHAGRWWLICTDNDRGPDSHLSVWHSRELLGPWKPHEANPVKVDLATARPAGPPFMLEGHLYRPSQDCSRTYGGRIIINHLSRLTPREFEERPVAAIGPFANSPYPEGAHTLSSHGGLTLVDGFRFRCFRTAMKDAIGREFSFRINTLGTLLKGSGRVPATDEADNL